MKNLNGQYCFTHTNGEGIYLFTLRNEKGTSVSITNYGAIITSFILKNPRYGSKDIVLGFDKVEDYLAEEYLVGYPYFGSAIGRYGNRIKNGEFHIDGKKYTVARNKGNDHLHGGIEGFDKKVWEFESGNDQQLRLKYLSPDGEEGYPGNLEAVIHFELTNDDELIYEYFATTDQPTAVNLTHHSYFNLDGKGHIGSQQVKINASSILEQDDNFVVTGNEIPVEENRYDFRKFKRIDKDWDAADGYDQSFVLDKNDNSCTLAAEAYSETSQIKLEVYTTEPLVHYYTGKWIAPMVGKNGDSYGPFSGFCFETQKHPNAINIPSFPNTILRPGENYYTKTVYKVIH